MSEKIYDWIVIGSGAAGISIGEILTRAGLNVAIIEKNSEVASETTKIFHEWLHTGALYTLQLGGLKTTKYLLGAIDDLFEYYGCYKGMNLVKSECGLSVDSNGWFNDDNIYFKYKRHRTNLLWNTAISRSIGIIEQINNHDWLRRRAGSIDISSHKYIIDIFKNYPNNKSEFYEYRSSDLTINSRVLLSDLIKQFEGRGGSIFLDTNVIKIEENRHVNLYTSSGNFYARNIVVCAPDLLSTHFKKNITRSLAPMMVFDGVEGDQQSFVELDFNPKNCINLLNKGGGYALAGGISVDNFQEVTPYLDYCKKIHLIRNPNLKIVDTYIGVKKEMIDDGKKRNYLYQINKVSEKIWITSLGKFTLMFSLAPEFYRRVLHQNPNTEVNIVNGTNSNNYKKLSETMWAEISKRRK